MDARAHIANPNIDYQTVHFYAESFSIAPWNVSSYLTYYVANRALMARTYALVQHCCHHPSPPSPTLYRHCHCRYNKPTVLEEIGILTGTQPSRDAFFSAAFAAANYAGCAGVLVWQAR